MRDFDAALVFESGVVMEGYFCGETKATSGEICFNTAMTGYQEIVTDPSYAGQIINFTFPHIGNVGANLEDTEGRDVLAKGVILHEEITDLSNWRSEGHFNEWLKKHKITGICGVDTRFVTQYIRENGAQNVAIVPITEVSKAKEILEKTEDMTGLDLASRVSTTKAYEVNKSVWSNEKNGSNDKLLFTKSSTVLQGKKIAVIDFGVKENILSCISSLGADVTVLPMTTSVEELKKLNLDGICLSNGPGDPEASYKKCKELIDYIVSNSVQVPVLAICLGHQIIGLTLGGKTFKMKQGHRGANHPIKNLLTGVVEITSQNHGFSVENEEKVKQYVSHISLFDGTVAGFYSNGDKYKFISVQYHPESSPGPLDSRYIFLEYAKFFQK